MKDRHMFRGKDVNGEWYTGLLSESLGWCGSPEKGYYISNDNYKPWAYQVRPETVGQCTGLKDKNGKLIYEGDVVKITPDPESKNIHETHDVYFDEELCEFGFHMTMLPLWGQLKDEYVIIGNIHDNPELPKEAK